MLGFYLLLILGNLNLRRIPPKNVWHLQKAGLFEGFLRKYPPGNEHIPYQGTLEDDFPFPQVGYVIVPWRVLLFHLSPSSPIFNPKRRFFFLQQNLGRQALVYIHCTAGLGRAPATALAYMFLIQQMDLDEAYAELSPDLSWENGSKWGQT